MWAFKVPQEVVLIKVKARNCCCNGSEGEKTETAPMMVKKERKQKLLQQRFRRKVNRYGTVATMAEKDRKQIMC